MRTGFLHIVSLVLLCWGALAGSPTRQMLDLPSWRVGAVCRLCLPGGRELDVTVTRHFPTTWGASVFLASAADGAQVVLVRRSEDYTLTVRMPECPTGDVYSVRDGQLYHRTTDARRFVNRCSVSLSQGVKREGILRYWTPVDPPESDGKDTLLDVIDVLIAYDAPAANWLHETGWDAEVFAEVQIARMNAVLENSGLLDDFRFRLVGVRILTTNVKGLGNGKDNESRFSAALSTLSDASFRSLRAGEDLRGLVEARYATGADVAVLFAHTGTTDGTLGAGYPLQCENGAWNSPANLAACGRRAFCVCEIASVESSYVMVHEVGHLLGAGHPSKEQVNPDLITVGPQLFNDSCAFLFNYGQRRYFTIMGYPWDGYGGTDFTPLPVFSSPALTFCDGDVETGLPLGVAERCDNVSTIRQSFSYVARYRTHVVPSPGLREVSVRIATEGGGTVKGAGRYMPGDEVRLSQVSARGYVFAGWHVIDAAGITNALVTGRDFWASSYAFTLGTNDLDIVARFVQKNAKTDSVREIVPQFDPLLFRAGVACLYVPVATAVSASRPTFSMAGLPPGLSFRSSTETLSGQPTKPGRYKVTLTARNESGASCRTNIVIVVGNWRDESLPLDEVYEDLVPGVPVVFDFSAFAKGCSVSGLPPGLTWSSKKGMLSGTPTRPATNVVVFMRTDRDAVRGTRVFRKASATFSVGCYPVLTLVADGAGTGKLVGAGKYAANRTVTLRAVQDTRNVMATAKRPEKRRSAFAGWWDAEGRLVSRMATCTFKMPAVDTVLYGRFVTAEEDADSVWAALSGERLDALEPPSVTNLCGVAVDWPLEGDALSTTTVSVLGLPTGLRYNRKSASIVGTPTVASKTNAKTGEVIPSKVRVKVVTAGGNVKIYGVDLFLMPLPAWAVGTFNGGSATCSATFTVSKAGRISSAFRDGTGKWSLTASSFRSGFFHWERGAEGLVADLVGKQGKRAVTNRIAVIDAGVAGMVTNEDCRAVKNLWATNPYRNLARRLYATGTHIILSDAGRFSFRFSTSGTATIAASFTGEPFGTYTVALSAPLCVISATEDAFRAVLHLHVPPNKARGFPGFDARAWIDVEGDDLKIQFAHPENQFDKEEVKE